MPENITDQKGQGNLNDQNSKSGQTTEGTSGQTTNKSTLNENQDLQKGNDKNTSGSAGTQMRTENAEKSTEKNAGIQNQDTTIPPQQKQKDSDITNLEDDDEEEIHEYEDLEHPHKVETPRASGQTGSVLGENTIEGENQGADRITNKSEDKAF